MEDAIRVLRDVVKSSRMTALIADSIYREHETGAGHPEQVARFDAVMGALAGMAGLVRVAPREAAEDEIALVHTRR